MNHLPKLALLALAAVLVTTGCKKNDETSNLVTQKVNISLPSDFPASAKYTGEAVLTSTTTTRSYTVTAVNGVATFEDIYQDVYDVQVQQTLTASQFYALAPELAGADNTQSVLLNGTKLNVAVAKNSSDMVPDINIGLMFSYAAQLVISKIYCNGTRNNNGSANNMPKYWEIFNNTDEVVYLDGLCFAEAHGLNTSVNPCELYVLHQREATYAQRIATFPGTHGVTRNIPLDPGKSVVIAWHASNFIITEEGYDKCTMNCDLSHADWEIESTNWIWEEYGDNVNVPNLTPIYDAAPWSGFLGMNQALFIFFATKAEVDSWSTDNDESSYIYGSDKLLQAKRVPNNIIINAVQIFKADANQQKQIPDALDASGIESANNEGIIFDRKISEITPEGRIILRNTNNSVNDFVAIGSRDRTNYSGAHLVPGDYTKPEIQP